MFDSNLLKPINACSYTGFESLYLKSSAYTSFAPNVIIFTSNHAQTCRLLVRDSKTCKYVSGLLLNRLHGSKVYDIVGVYTDPDYRRQGLAKGLLAVAKVCFKDVRHSPHLTEFGQKFAGV